MINIALIMGVIGTITGVISLIWHIHNSRPKIVMESAYFNKEQIYHNKDEGDIQYINVKINLRNLGNRSSTIESVFITLGNRVMPQEENIPIYSNSSKILDYHLSFKKREFDELYKNGQLHFEVFVEHTFDTIRRKGDSNFLTGHFTI